MQLADNFTLEKNDVLLSMLTPNDQIALEKISHDPRIWLHNPGFNDPTQFREHWFKKALQQKFSGKRIPFVIHYHQYVIGSTSFYDIDIQNKQLVIGYTWLHPDYWGKGINEIVKQTLLEYIFDTGNFNRVNFVIDILNKRSRAAVEKLGAIQAEIIPNHMQRPDGSMRDSIVYSLFANNILPEMK